MEKYALEKHRKLIESVRLIGMITLGIFAGFHFLLALVLAIIIGTLDQIFVVPKLKPKRKHAD